MVRKRSNHSPSAWVCHHPFLAHKQILRLLCRAIGARRALCTLYRTQEMRKGVSSEDGGHKLCPQPSGPGSQDRRLRILHCTLHWQTAPQGLLKFPTTSKLLWTPPGLQGLILAGSVGNCKLSKKLHELPSPASPFTTAFICSQRASTPESLLFSRVILLISGRAFIYLILDSIWWWLIL